MTDRFVEQGYSVAGCGRSREAIDTLCNTHRSPHAFEVVDVADAGQVKAWAKRVLAASGAPDYLINNASLMNKNAPLWEVPPQEFAALMRTNVEGTANMIHAFVPAMIERGSGVIVNFSSGWGRSTAPDVAPYCTSKWAIEGLTRALSQELPAGLAAVAVNPGIINTEMLRTCWGEAALNHASPEDWSRGAVPFILNLDEKDNGKSLSIS
jgi:NAD(P)-dependent dehydrogenase (short-subunit alcohol dehydrogenase family)